MSRFHTTARGFLLIAVLAATACGSAETVTRTCGAGTALSADGECVPLLSCGEGTALSEDDRCQATSATLICRGDTTLVEGQCIANLALRTCGSGAVLEGDVCVPEILPVSCGTGTQLEGTVCISEDPLVCGENTVERSRECLAGTCGSGTVREGDLCVGNDYRTEGGLESFVFRFVRGLCESATRCECLDPEIPIMAAAMEHTEVCETLIRGSSLGIYLGFLNYSAMVGQLEADEAGIEDVMAWISGAEDCSVDLLEVHDGFPRGLLDLGDIVTAPSVEAGERCGIPQVCVDGTVCQVPESEGEEELPPVCVVRGEDDAPCVTHGHCAETHYCNVGGQCALRPSPTSEDPTCSLSNKPCAAGFCCSEGLCAAAPAETDPCCNGGCIGDALYCKPVEDESSCQLYPTDGGSCVDDGLCAVGFACVDEGTEETPDQRCRGTISVCQVVDWINMFLSPS